MYKGVSLFIWELTFVYTAEAFIVSGFFSKSGFKEHPVRAVEASIQIIVEHIKSLFFIRISFKLMTILLYIICSKWKGICYPN